MKRRIFLKYAASITTAAFCVNILLVDCAMGLQVRLNTTREEFRQDYALAMDVLWIKGTAALIESGEKKDTTPPESLGGLFIEKAFIVEELRELCVSFEARSKGSPLELGAVFSLIAPLEQTQKEQYLRHYINEHADEILIKLSGGDIILRYYNPAKKIAPFDESFIRAESWDKTIGPELKREVWFRRSLRQGADNNEAVKILEEKAPENKIEDVRPGINTGEGGFLREHGGKLIIFISVTLALTGCSDGGKVAYFAENIGILLGAVTAGYIVSLRLFRYILKDVKAGKRQNTYFRPRVLALEALEPKLQLSLALPFLAGNVEIAGQNEGPLTVDMGEPYSIDSIVGLLSKDFAVRSVDHKDAMTSGNINYISEDGRVVKLDWAPRFTKNGIETVFKPSYSVAVSLSPEGGYYPARVLRVDYPDGSYDMYSYASDDIERNDLVRIDNISTAGVIEFSYVLNEDSGAETILKYGANGVVTDEYAPNGTQTAHHEYYLNWNRKLTVNMSYGFITGVIRYADDFPGGAGVGTKTEEFKGIVRVEFYPGKDTPKTAFVYDNIDYSDPQDPVVGKVIKQFDYSPDGVIIDDSGEGQGGWSYLVYYMTPYKIAAKAVPKYGWQEILYDTEAPTSWLAFCNFSGVYRIYNLHDLLVGTIKRIPIDSSGGGIVPDMRKLDEALEKELKNSMNRVAAQIIEDNSEAKTAEELLKKNMSAAIVKEDPADEYYTVKIFDAEGRVIAEFRIDEDGNIVGMTKEEMQAMIDKIFKHFGMRRAGPSAKKLIFDRVYDEIGRQADDSEYSVVSMAAVLGAMSLIIDVDNKGGRRTAEYSAGSMNEYTAKQEDILKRIFGEGSSPVLVRVPIEVLEGADPDSVISALSALDRSNVYVELFTMSSPDTIIKERGIYEKYSFERFFDRPFPAGVRRDRFNTVTMFGATTEFGKRELQDSIMTSQAFKDSILVPVGLRGDAAGIARALLFGLRLIYIARHRNEINIEAFMIETIDQYKSLIESFGVTPPALSGFDIEFLTGEWNNKDINLLVETLQKLISALPIRPIPADEVRGIYERVRLVIESA